MTKYEENTFYIGNLIEYKDGKARINKENLYLIYSQEKDKFISFVDAYAPSIDILNPNLTEKEKINILNQMNKHYYSYKPTEVEGKKYIDENSIQLLTPSSKKNRT